MKLDDDWGDMWNWQVGMCVFGYWCLIAVIVVTFPIWLPFACLGNWARKNSAKAGEGNR